MNKRGLPVLIVLALLLLAAGALLLPGRFGGEGLLESQTTDTFLQNPDAYCDERSLACQSVIATAISDARPTPLVDDPRLRDVFLADDVVQNLTAARVEGLDYWMKIDSWREKEHGVAGGTAFIFFESPVSFDAEISYSVNPCAPYSSEGVAPPNHPCLDEPFKFTTRYTVFDSVYQLRANIDPDSGLVFDMIESRFDAATIQQFKDEAD